MGIGDELMLAGEAKRRAAGRAMRFHMLDKTGAPRWHFIWDGNPLVARPHERADDTIGFTVGRRPYCESVSPERYVWKRYRPEPGFIPVTPRMQQYARMTAGAIVVNPTIKPRASPNKAWPMLYWKRLLRICGDLRWVQIGDGGGERLRNAEFIPTATFYEACGALMGARAAVLHEGGLHHGAAALGLRRVVVIFGGYISPEVTGYDGQASLFVPSGPWPLGCGQRTRCGHCAAAMESITPEKVAARLRALLNEKATA